MLLAKNLFEFHARVQKCHFVNFSFLPKWHFCMKFKKNFGQKHSFEALWKWWYKFFFVTCPRVCQIQDLCRKKYKKGIFSEVQWWKKFSTHFSDSTHQECMIFARIGNGPCYHHWTEIFAGVHEKGAIWQSHLAAQKEGVVTAIIFSNHKTS